MSVPLVGFNHRPVTPPHPTPLTTICPSFLPSRPLFRPPHLQHLYRKKRPLKKTSPLTALEPREEVWDIGRIVGAAWRGGRNRPLAALLIPRGLRRAAGRLLSPQRGARMARGEGRRGVRAISCNTTATGWYQTRKNIKQGTTTLCNGADKKCSEACFHISPIANTTAVCIGEAHYCCLYRRGSILNNDSACPPPHEPTHVGKKNNDAHSFLPPSKYLALYATTSVCAKTWTTTPKQAPDR